MTRRDQIRSAYRLTGSNAGFYDGMMTYSTLLGKAVCRLVWNMDGEKNLAYLEKALSGVPEGFSGKLLDIKTPNLIQFNYSTAAYLQAG